jgi:hypothetical protein
MEGKGNILQTATNYASHKAVYVWFVCCLLFQFGRFNETKRNSPILWYSLNTTPPIKPSWTYGETSYTTTIIISTTTTTTITIANSPPSQTILVAKARVLVETNVVYAAVAYCRGRLDSGSANATFASMWCNERS